MAPTIRRATTVAVSSYAYKTAPASKQKKAHWHAPLFETTVKVEYLRTRLGLLGLAPQKCRHIQIIHVLVHFANRLLHRSMMHDRCRRRWWRFFLHLLSDFHFLHFRPSLPGFRQ